MGKCAESKIRPALSYLVTLGNLLSFSEPQFPHSKMEREILSIFQDFPSVPFLACTLLGAPIQTWTFKCHLGADDAPKLEDFP